MINGFGASTAGILGVAYMNQSANAAAANGPLSPGELAKLSEAELKSLKKAGKVECEACNNRQYVDGSNDPGVSFKTPTKIDPKQAASKVYSHEREHHSRSAAKAKREGRDVLSNTIRMQNSICPECGRAYVSGGETRTVTKGKDDPNPRNQGGWEGDKPNFETWL